MDLLLPVLLMAILLISWTGMGILLRWLVLNHKSERNQWEMERERLMNRVMTKEWESYTQMVSRMIGSPISPSNSDSDEGKGLSDEEELRRWSIAMQEGVGVGEVLVDRTDDLKELGLEPEAR